MIAIKQERDICGYLKRVLNIESVLQCLKAGTCCLLWGINSFIFIYIYMYVFMWYKWSQLSKRTNVSLHGGFFFFKLENVVSVLIPQSSNLITLLKLISLVNICLCAGLKGLIRPGTCRPPGQYPSFCTKNLVKAEIRWKSTFIPVLNFYARVRGVSCPQQDNLPFFSFLFLNLKTFV